MAHAKTFLNRPDFNLATAKRGTFSFLPPQDNDAQLVGEFKNTEAMIFGEAPSLDAILATIGALDGQWNRV